MRTIAVPPNVELKHPMTGASVEWVSFRRWFIETVLADQRMGISPVKLARVMAMMAKAEAVEVGGALALEDADYEACKVVVVEPKLALGNPVVAGQLLPFSTAFLAAE